MSILSTRPAGEADPLVAALRTAGHQVHAVPTVITRTVDPESALGAQLGAAAAALRAYDWVVLTSATGVSALLAAVERAGTLEGLVDRGEGAAVRPQWAAVGRSTAAALTAAGLLVGAVPRGERGREFTAALAAQGPLTGQRILLPRSDLADGALPRDLRTAGAVVEDVVAYHTVEGPPESAEPLREALADDTIETIVLCSGSAVRGLLALSAGDRPGPPHPRVAATPLVSIGPVTSEAIRAAGLAVAVEASRPSVDALVAAVGLLLAPAAHPAALDPTLTAPGARP